MDLARHIQCSRKRFRHNMLATDYMLQAAVGLLESIRDGRARLDRTIEVSVINLREKRRLLKLLGPNLHTLEQPHAPQPPGLPDRRPQGTASQTAASRLGSGWCAGGAGPCGWSKNSACGPQRLQPALDHLKQICRRMEDIRGQMAELGRDGEAGRPAQGTPQGTLPPHADHAGKPRHAPPPHHPHRRPRSPSTKAPSGTSPPATCGWSSPSPSATATAA